MDAVRCPHQENAVGWALYALEPAEEHALRAHLQGCPECRETIREAEEVAALLGTSVPQHEPPSALRRRLLDAIDDAPRPIVTPASELPPPIDLASRRRPRRVLLVAAAAVVIALGAATTVLGVQVSHLTSQQQAQAAGEAMAQAVIGSPSATRAVLTNAAGKPAAMLITSPAGAVVMPLALTPNTPNQSYVAWGLLPSGPTALTSFDVPAGSVGPIVVNWPAAAGGLDRFAISLEPGRIMPSTPTDVIASGSVA